MLILNNVSVSKGTTKNKEIIINDLSFKVGKGQLFLIMGKSGIGKTTLLETIAGLNKFDGDIKIFNTSHSENPDLFKSKVSIVFQNYPLFENLTVRKNFELHFIKSRKFSFEKEVRPLLEKGVVIGEELEKLTKKESNKQISKLQSQHKVSPYSKKTILNNSIEQFFKKLNLDIELQKRKPTSLSGGEKQRVSIACSLSKEPDVILFDEPTSNLDVLTKTKFYELLKSLKNENKIIIISTHEQDYELFHLANEIIYLDKQKNTDTSPAVIMQQGKYEDFIDKPFNKNIASFFNKLIEINSEDFNIEKNGFTHNSNFDIKLTNDSSDWKVVSSQKDKFFYYTTLSKSNKELTIITINKYESNSFCSLKIKELSKIFYD